MIVGNHHAGQCEVPLVQQRRNSGRGYQLVGGPNRFLSAFGHAPIPPQVQAGRNTMTVGSKGNRDARSAGFCLYGLMSKRAVCPRGAGPKAALGGGAGPGRVQFWCQVFTLRMIPGISGLNVHCRLDT